MILPTVRGLRSRLSPLPAPAWSTPPAFVGTEHILLGLFHAGDDTAARALSSLGAGEREVRGAITAVAGGPGPIRRAPGRAHKPGLRNDEIRLLRREVARLSDLLREHGIEPGEDNHKSA